MLDVLALIAAVFNVLLALLLAWGLSEQGSSGRPAMSVFAAAFLVSTTATVYAVVRLFDHGAAGWLAVTALPPLTMLTLLVVDRTVLWGNFPPSAPRRMLTRIGAVAVFALPALLAWTAS